MTKRLYFILFTLLICSCQKEEVSPTIPPEIPPASEFTVNNDHILKDGVPFPVKGVVYVPGYPGFLPWEIEKSTALPEHLKNSIYTDLTQIKNMGANTVRFWGAPKYCYEALDAIGGLHMIQTIWIQGDAPDLQQATFKAQTKSYIQEVIDRVYGAFDAHDPPLVAFLIGNELSESSIRNTDRLHPQITSYSGNHIHTGNAITASEAFIAEMADHARTYEMETYGRKTLLAYSNEIRTFDIIDVPFLDFIAHNAYSYAVPYYRPGTAGGSTTGTVFQGWVEEIRSKHPDQPLLITETGLSVSPNAAHAGPPDYGYGGNTPDEQAAGLLQNLNDINTTKLTTAGVCIHEYLDAWWKFGLEDSYTQDPDDIEEWFGLVKLHASNGWYSTSFRPSYHAIQEAWK